MIGVDVGGYVGEFIRHLQDTGCDDIFCFEPLNPWFDVCKSFTDHSEENIEVIKKGLYRDGEYYITPLSDGSSIFAEGETTEKIDCVSLHTFTKEKNITHIDYLKLNCEGCEYTILGDLIESNFMIFTFKFQLFKIVIINQRTLHSDRCRLAIDG